MPSIKFQSEGFSELALLASLWPRQIKDGAVVDVYMEARDFRDDVQGQMPIDTGWASIRFGDPNWNGVWEDKDAGLTVELGSDLDDNPAINPMTGRKVTYEYIRKLNEGSSQQAPAGFLDAATERAELRLSDRLEITLNATVS
jgi:hypothetical protein